MARGWQKGRLASALLLLAVTGLLAAAQCTSDANCVNYGTCLLPGTGGTSAGTAGTCSCPVGYGGSNCSTTLCTNPLVDNSLRSEKASGTPCTCDSGFAGENCNVCLNDNACRARQSTSATAAASAAGVDSSLVCNTSPYTYTTTYGDCAVNNSLLQSVFPGTTVLSFTKIVQPQTSNSTSISLNELQSHGANSTYAYISHEGIEQFYCHATSCSQALSGQTALGQANGNSTTWNCASLNCTCIPGTAFCGATSGLDLTSVLNQLAGPLSINCDNTLNGTCTFSQATLRGLFGSTGLILSGCTFGECLTRQVLASAAGPTVASSTSSGLSGGVIAGLAVVGAFVLALLCFILLGVLTQRRARRAPAVDHKLDGARLGLAWSDLSYRLKSRVLSRLPGFKQSSRAQSSAPILDHVSGEVPAGTVTAILGPSGAGKTTLVEILAGRHKAGIASGTFGFSHGSHDVAATPHLLSFVDQEDHLPALQTVREALQFAAYLSLPEPLSTSKKDLVVDELIEQLGLKSVANNRIGHASRRGISGGEKRRLSIGLALVSNPRLLILDEPSSGLDAVSATRIMHILTDLAHHQGTTVLLTVHQPSSAVFHSFDNIILLADGQTLYSGPSSEAASWLESIGRAVPPGYNVADRLLEAAFFNDAAMLEKKTSEASGNSVHDGIDSTKDIQAIPPVFASSCFFTQCQVLTRRELRNLSRDWYNFAYILIGAIIGVFVGGLFFKIQITIGGLQNRVGVFFFLCSLLSFASISSLIRFSHAKPLFRRERSSALYHAWTWLITYVISDILFVRMLPNLVMSLIIYWMAGLASSAAAFFKFWLIVFLVTVIASLFNMTLAALFPEQNAHVAIVISAVIILFNVGFSGYGLNLNSIPGVLNWIQYTAPLKYALEAMTVNDVSSADLSIQDTLEGVPINVSAVPILELLFGFNLDNYYRDVLILMAFLLGLAVALALIVLRYVKENT